MNFPVKGMIIATNLSRIRFLPLCVCRERMEAMEKQIASLTGLLQRVLSRAPEADSP